MKYHIVIVRPTGYSHSSCFQEIAETLMYGLRSLGHPAEIGENRLEHGAVNIILGSHLLALNTELPQGTVLYNLEQYDAPSLEGFKKLAKKNEVWDYSLLNIEKWKELGIQARHVPIGYVPELKRIPKGDEPIDVLFIGSMNPRRQKIIDGLKAAGLHVETLFDCYGKERDEWISKAKVVLNVHFYEAQIFEMVRVSYLLANHKAVVSETSRDVPEIDGVVFAEYGKLVETCVNLVKDNEFRAKLEGRASFAKESDILSFLGKKKSVYIAIPSRDSNCHMSFASSLVQLTTALMQKGYGFGIQFLGNEAHIIRARNHLSQLFMESNFSHLLFVDDDIAFEAADVIAMLEAEKDIIGLPCAKKAINWDSAEKAFSLKVDKAEIPEVVCSLNMNGLEQDAVDIMEPVEVRHIGTGAMLISRQVFEKMQVPEKEINNTEHDTKMMGIKTSNSYAYFNCEIGADKMFMGEDFYFCEEWRKLGGTIWMLPYARTVHYGPYAYICNIPKMVISGVIGEIQRDDSATELAHAGE